MRHAVQVQFYEPQSLMVILTQTQLHQTLGLEAQFMNPLCCRIRPTLSFATLRFKSILCSCSLAVNQVQELTETPLSEIRRLKSGIVPKEGEGSKRNGRIRVKDRVRVKFTDAQLKQNWLDALSCPFPEDVANFDCNVGGSGSSCVIGIDPDVSGALAVLRADESGLTAQVYDAPFVPVLVGKRSRKRLDAKSIVQLIRSLNAPLGTKAYIEQSTPFPQDGKLGWWGGGFGYGLWIGVLVASGFSVVPIPSAVWKNKLKLSGNRSSKDDCRLLASKLFPSLSDHLKRKKDHGRAEALLIAAYGKGLKVDSDSPSLSEVDPVEDFQ